MHVLTSIGMDDSSSASMSPHHAVALVDSSAQTSDMHPNGPTSAEDCDGICGTSHDMLGMMCVLGLLVSVVLLVLHLIVIRWAELLRPLSGLVAKAATLAPPEPPSLYVLSISRT